MYFHTGLISKTVGRSRAERLLNILEGIADSSPDGIWVCDAEGVMVAFNDTSARYIGVPAAELIGRSIYELARQPFIDQCATIEVLDKQRPVNKLIQMPLTGKNLLVTAKPIFDDRGELEMVIVTDRDITTLLEIQNELDKREASLDRLKTELNLLRTIEGQDEDLVCQSPGFADAVRTALMLASLDESNILLLGESGTGKGRLARLIHENSRRSERELVHLNCSALPESLLEAELFGYEKGAFTGAGPKGKPGLLEVAEKGTVFLDEIGELPLAIQSKILTFLDTYQITRLGGTRAVRVDCKIIAATNRDLSAMAAEGRFRSDLYYRLNTFAIQVPPLRDRAEDLYELAFRLIDRYNRKYRKQCRLGPEGFSLLHRYPFPGNVRELDNLIKRAVALTEDQLLDRTIGRYVESESGLRPGPPPTEAASPGLDLKALTIQFEKLTILEAMKGTTNTRQLADRLKVSQATALRKMKRAGIRYRPRAETE